MNQTDDILTHMTTTNTTNEIGTMKITEIKAGTILVSNSQSGPSFCQVVEFVKAVELWQMDHLLAVKDGEFIQVGSVGPEDMLGIGWKLASESDIVRMARYRKATV